jgi:hypothetical protein
MSAILEDLLDILIPGDAVFPNPSTIGLARRLAAHDRFGPVVAELCKQLPAGFSGLAFDGKTQAVAAIEAGQPQAFGVFLIAVYSLYYTDAQVLEAIAATSGYEARAPQPLGYELEPFDPAMIAVPASRAPHYRTVP